MMSYYTNSQLIFFWFAICFSYYCMKCELLRSPKQNLKNSYKRIFPLSFQLKLMDTSKVYIFFKLLIFKLEKKYSCHQWTKLWVELNSPFFFLFLFQRIYIYLLQKKKTHFSIEIEKEKRHIFKSINDTILVTYANVPVNRKHTKVYRIYIF